MKRLIIKRADGGVSIAEVPSMDNSEYFHRWEMAMRKNHPEYLPATWEIVDLEVPTDRSFRDAWAVNGKKIDVDMVKARVLHLDRIRKARAPKLAELDIEYQKADEAGDTDRKAEIATIKNILRDLPEILPIEETKTPAELKAIWPKELD